MAQRRNGHERRSQSVKDFLTSKISPSPALQLQYMIFRKKVLEQSLQAGNMLIDTRHLEAGYYLVKIRYADGAMKSVKVVKL